MARHSSRNICEKAPSTLAVRRLKITCRTRIACLQALCCYDLLLHGRLQYRL